jgi:hypothetical protein
MQTDRWTGDLINLLPFFESRIKIVLFVDHCPAHPAIKLRNNNLVDVQSCLLGCTAV